MTKARDLASGGFGLVLIKPSTVVGGTDNGKGTVSFSAVTSVSLNGVFNSTYDNYRIVVNNSAFSIDGYRYIKLKSGTSELSTGYTYAVGGIATNNTAYPLYSGSQAFWNLGDTDAGTNSVYGVVIDLINPFNAVYTNMLMTGHSSSGAQLFFANAGGGTNLNAASYDGISITTSSGTMSGTVSVYGYNK